MYPNDGHVVSSLIGQALRNEPLTIYGNGFQFRSFCYVDDLVDAIVRLVRMPHEITRPINLGNPTELSMVELASKIIFLSGSDSSLVYASLSSDEPQRRQPDISMARAKLEWAPTIAIDEGLAKTIAFFLKNLKSLISNNYVLRAWLDVRG
jgi:UDP-glucuronate decarboxylase